MSLSNDGMRRLSSLNLTGEQFAEVLRVFADDTSSDENRRRKDRERKAAKRGHSADSPQKVHGNSADIPQTDASPRVRVLYAEKVEDIPSLRSGADAPSAEPVFQNAKQELWAIGPDLLRELGEPKSKTRSLIGKFLKDTGDNAEAVLDVIRRCRQQKPIDPIPWIVRGLPMARGSPNGQKQARIESDAAFFKWAMEPDDEPRNSQTAENFDGPTIDAVAARVS